MQSTTNLVNRTILVDFGNPKKGPDPQLESRCIRLFFPYLFIEILLKIKNKHCGPVAQWITRLPTEQKIAGSIPAWICFFKEIISFGSYRQFIYRIVGGKFNFLFFFKVLLAGVLGCRPWRFFPSFCSFLEPFIDLPRFIILNEEPFFTWRVRNGKLKTKTKKRTKFKMTGHHFLTLQLSKAKLFEFSFAPSESVLSVSTCRFSML